MRLAAVLLLLASCGSASIPGAAEMVVVQYGDITAGGQAIYGESVTTVLVNPDNNRFDNGVVIAHELMHVAGFVEHIGGECLFSENPYVVEREPCPVEINMIRSVTRTYTITVLDSELLDATIWAANLWNEAAERDVFLVAAH